MSIGRIGVENKYFFTFEIEAKADKGQKKLVDFIYEDNFQTFYIEEIAGGVLPMFNLEFELEEQKYLTYFNEGNKIFLTCGVVETEETVITELVICYKENKSVTNKSYSIRLSGIVGKLSFVKIPRTRIFKNKSGIEVVKEVIKGQYFWDNLNPKLSKDKQNWIQSNVSDRYFVTDVLLHSEISDSFILFGIDMNGKFIIRDSKTLLKQDYTWNFNKLGGDSKKDLIYDHCTAVDRSGLVYKVAGYGYKQKLYDLEKGDHSDIEIKPRHSFSAMSKLPLNKDVPIMNIYPTIKNSNVHINYRKSYINNFCNLALCSSIAVLVSFKEYYSTISILDTAFLSITSVENNMESTLVDSGKYVVGRVVRAIGGKTLITNVYLYRESMNEQYGDFR